MIWLKRFIKLNIAGLLYYSGLLRIFRWLANRRRPGRTLVLVYHSVVAEREARSGRDRADGSAVGARIFECQMEHLARNYVMVPLERLVASLRGGPPLPENACILTFDDGSENNYRVAFPVLRRLGFPATFFIPTSFVGTEKLPWFVEIKELAEQLPDTGFRAEILTDLKDDPEIGRLLEEVSSGHGAGAVRRLMAALKELPAERIQLILQGLRSFLKLDGPLASRVVMSPEEIRRMAAAGMSFGSHTHSHCILTVEPKEGASREILESKRELETVLGTSVDGFAYPNGCSTPEIRQWVARAGYEYACGMEEHSSDLRSDRYNLPRKEINEVKSTGLMGHFSPALFEATIQGVFGLVPGRRFRQGPLPGVTRHNDAKYSALDSQR